MASRFRYNPQTNRWESGAPAIAPTTQPGRDNPPPGWFPNIGSTYVDTVTGETKMYMGRQPWGPEMPDQVIAGPSTTTVPRNTTARTSGAPPTTTTPRTSGAPTTTAPSSTREPNSRGGNQNRQTEGTSRGSTTTTVPKGTPSPTTTVPKGTPSPTTTVPKGGTGATTTTTVPATPTTPSTTNTPPADTTVADALKQIFSTGIDSKLLNLLLGSGSSGGGGSGPSAAQKTATAKKIGQQNLALAKKYYGQQQRQGQQQIDAATAELLANMQAPTAYSNLPLVTVPPALQGLQQNLLSYGGTGQQAAGQASQDQQAADMYTALARRGAEQMGQAESGYFEALKRAALQAQAAGRQGLAQTANDLQAQVMLQNLQAIINAQQ